MILKEYRSGETGLEWYATDASWAPGCQAEDEWLLEAWERMTSSLPLSRQIGWYPTGEIRMNHSIFWLP